MSLKRLDDLDHMAAADLADYARRRGFAPGLTDSLAATLHRSILGKDGALWTDSFLVTCLLSDESSIRTLFDRIPGIRSWAVSKDDFASTLSTRHLTVQPKLPRTLDEEFLRIRSRDKSQITEAKFLEIELELALSQFMDNNTELSFFIGEVTGPITASALSVGKAAATSALHRMSNILADCVWISMLARQHPFASLGSLPQNLKSARSRSNVKTSPYAKIAERFSASSFDRARRLFYWRLRDSASASPTTLNDNELLEFANRFDRTVFTDVCDKMTEHYWDEHDEEADEGTTGDRLYEYTLYASAMLWNRDLSLAFLSERLGSWHQSAEEQLWPTSSKTLISDGVRQLEVMRCDVSTDMTYDSDSSAVGSQLAQVGIWSPSPVWTNSVLDRLEYLINQPNIGEQELQYFFEAYPQFILNELHVEAIPQVVLYQEHGPNLRPDFVLRRADSDFIDILDLKLPQARTVTGSTARPSPSHSVVKGISQLKEYRDWFRSPHNQRLFRDKYGLQGYEPRLTLVIGRSSPFVDPIVKQKAFSGAEAEIVTYDEVDASARRRRAWLGQ